MSAKMSEEGRARTVDAAGAERHEARRKQAHCTPAHTGRIYSAQPAAVSTRAVRENPALLSAGRRLPASTGGCACVGAVVRAAEAVGGAPLGSGPAALARAALARPPPPRGTAGVCGWRPVLRCRRASPPAISPAISGSCHTASQPAARGPGCASLGGASASRCSTHATKPSAAAVRSRV